MIEEITIKREELTVSSALWAHYKRLPDGLVEDCLSENMGLSDVVFIPIGTVIRVPVKRLFQNAEPARQVIRLWS
ncbi:MAG: tail protein X [Ahrensia sp.]|nr:tail protein X [Ahrensia sp.]